MKPFAIIMRLFLARGLIGYHCHLSLLALASIARRFKTYASS